jgi:hypothetical protein
MAIVAPKAAICAALDHVNAEISVDAGQDQAGHERPNQKGEDFHVSP